MNDPSRWLQKKLNRLEFLSEILESKGFTQMALEVKSLRTETEVKAFLEAFKSWLF